MTLPLGYSLDRDADGDWVLTPPADVTIFSEPGEGLLIGDCTREEAEADALEHLAAIGIANKQPRLAHQSNQPA